MNIPADTDINSPVGFYIADFDVFMQTLSECDIAQTFELGGVTIHYGWRGKHPAWLLDNPNGSYAIWIENAGDVH